MRFPVGLTIFAAGVGLSAILIFGQWLIQPDVPLILDAHFVDEVITPNADGENDITTLFYELSRNAHISMIFEAEDGTTYAFREDESRIAREYSVLFSGVVAGFVLDGEHIPGTVERRLLPDGLYTWRLIAENAHEREEVRGTLRIEAGDSPLPIMSTFTVGSNEFTPNQDGINDRVIINVYLEKEEADVRVFLLGEKGQEIPITERVEETSTEQGQRYTFDYAGGVDLGSDPPPDGTYTVVAFAQDDEGQRTRRQADLTIRQGGKPRAEIAPQAVNADVVWAVQPYEDIFAGNFESPGQRIALPDFPEAVNVNLNTVPLGEMLVFRLTVENYSDVPIRTTGPPPGTVYQQDQMAASLGAFQEPGAWRVGIQCDTSTESFPYRWAIGVEDDLEVLVDPETGREFYYLPANTRSVVWGAIRMTDLIEQQNPQTCWAGLIHEQVEVSLRNSFVGPREIELVDPLGNNRQ